VFQSNCVLLPGWPKIISGHNVLLNSHTPAVGDIDADGDLEIVVQTDDFNPAGKIYAFHHNGNIVEGWPQQMGFGWVSSPILGDLDADGDLEIIAGGYEVIQTAPSYLTRGRIYIWHHNGSPMGGWPKDLNDTLVPAGLSLADIDRDGKIEIIVSVLKPAFPFDNSIYVFSTSGRIIWSGGTTGGPIGDSAPVVVDINGDGKLEIVIAAGNKPWPGEIAIFNKDGNKMESLSRYINDPIRATPTVGDLDGDSKLELAVGTTFGRILVWDIDGADSKMNTPWPLIQYNSQRTGCYSLPQVGTISPPIGSSKVNTPVTFTTTYTDPNGWQDIQYVHLLINTAITGLNSFYGYYNQNTNMLYLRNDANTVWLGGFAPGSANIIENSYVKLNCSKTTVSGSGNTLTVKWNITFESTFTGTKNAYLYIKDDAGAYQGWIKKGTWTINP